MKVRVNSTYRYDPVALDRVDPPYGVTQGILSKGDIVKVVNLPGCPKANTMGHCHIEIEGQFAGMVHTNSLQRK
tara:strand:- start:324 stop:545 length:222 start_codon:yes stop_codon:yes gene_type:complete